MRSHSPQGISWGDPTAMKVLIIGAGLIGVTSAYMLASRGWEVTVLERNEGPGLETSFANGALLTPSMPEPWNAPGSWKVLVRSLVSSNSALQLRLTAVPSLLGWGTHFLRESRRTRFERNARTNLALALHSMMMMSRLRRETGIEYGRAAPGTLRLFRDPVTLERALAWAGRLNSGGLEHRALNRTQVLALEPALGPVGQQLSGGIHYPQDEIGDAYKFCLAMTELARRKGVKFHFGAPVADFELGRRGVNAVSAGERRFAADRYVVAAGSFSSQLLRKVGIKIPVQPAKGYSITFDRPPEVSSLRVSVVDDAYHAAVVPLGNVIRVAGTAEFAGYDRSLSEPRIRNLQALVDRVLPQVRLERAAVRPWCGLRPMSPDGVPLIGRTPIDNLWVNTGHGHLGWTLAAGSASVLSDLLMGDNPTLDRTAFAPGRFLRS